MMKKKVIILMLVGMFCLTACGQPLNNQPKDTPIQEEQDDTDDLDNKEQEDQEQITELEEEEPKGNDNDTDVKDTKTPAETVAITVYSSNDDATAFVSEEIQISELSPEGVLSALVDKGVITSDIEVHSFQTTTVEGRASIEIDFNNAFASYVMSMGSTGEYYIMGSICNTFLSAYDCEQIKITVEGAVLETGHKDYPGYMNTFS
jgi:hypothetical protein